MTIMLGYVEGKTITSLSEDLKITFSTLSNYFNYFSQVIHMEIELRKEFYELGREWVVDDKLNPEYEDDYEHSAAVEIDESLLTHLVDDSRSLIQNQQWVLGIYDRGTHEVRVYCVSIAPHKRFCPLFERTFFSDRLKESKIV